MKLFLDMTDHPEKYSDEELQRLVIDEDMREWYEVLNIATDAFVSETYTVPDEKEMREMLREIENSAKGKYGGRLKVAAVIAGIIMFGGIAFASFTWIKSEKQPSKRMEVAAVNTVEKHSAERKASSSVRTFDNIPLDSVLSVVAAHYSLRVEYKEDLLRRLRFHVDWYPERDIHDFVEVLNQFDGIHIRCEGNVLMVEPLAEEGQE
ncbi:MAG: DUF4974 domain-containing protein [Prevotellaceae bacterium]|nr:DUF4974 domain-containing protein [Prevotella sp.]MDD7257345.1 DUF4974 domain-containing protein [Prevotellaceae bacterium]MDY6131080.1 DUF4974 domain-containing protein [Prevotella sp.]